MASFQSFKACIVLILITDILSITSLHNMRGCHLSLMLVLLCHPLWVRNELFNVQHLTEKERAMKQWGRGPLPGLYPGVDSNWREKNSMIIYCSGSESMQEFIWSSVINGVLNAELANRYLKFLEAWIGERLELSAGRDWPLLQKSWAPLILL